MFYDHRRKCTELLFQSTALALCRSEDEFTLEKLVPSTIVIYNKDHKRFNPQFFRFLWLQPLQALESP